MQKYLDISDIQKFRNLTTQHMRKINVLQQMRGKTTKRMTWDTVVTAYKEM